MDGIHWRVTPLRRYLASSFTSETGPPPSRNKPAYCDLDSPLLVRQLARMPSGETGTVHLPPPVDRRSGVEVLRLWVVGYERVGGLFGHKLELLRQAHTDPLRAQ